jgi:hypothetical protein
LCNSISKCKSLISGNNAHHSLRKSARSDVLLVSSVSEECVRVYATMCPPPHMPSQRLPLQYNKGTVKIYPLNYIIILLNSEFLRLHVLCICFSRFVYRLLFTKLIYLHLPIIPISQSSTIGCMMYNLNDNSPHWLPSVILEQASPKMPKNW